MTRDKRACGWLSSDWMSSKALLIAEHSEVIDDVVGAALYLSLISCIDSARFAYSKMRDVAAVAIDREYILGDALSE